MQISNPVMLKVDPNLVLSPKNFWYLHGKLEDILGYDKAEFTEDPGKLSGIYEVEVVGISGECIGFFWMREDQQRGLVCFKEDLEACQVAIRKYTERASTI